MTQRDDQTALIDAILDAAQVRSEAAGHDLTPGEQLAYDRHRSRAVELLNRLLCPFDVP